MERRLYGLAIAGCCISFVMMAIWPRTGTDANYYLAVARLAWDGMQPLKDFHSAYTPLVSLLVAPVTVMGSAAERVGMFVHVGLWLAIGGLLMAMAKERQWATVALWSVLGVGTGTVSGLWLENFSLFFIILGVYALVRAPRSFAAWSLAGVSIGLATLSKQYGILGLPFLFLFALAEGSFRWAQAAVAFTMTAVVGLVFVGLTVEGVDDIRRLVVELSGGGYLQHVSGTRTVKAYVVEGLPVWLALIPGLVWAMQGSKRWLTLFGALLMLLPLMVRHYEHYYVYAAGWVLVMVVRHAPRSSTWLAGALVMASLLANGLCGARSLRYRTMSADEARLTEAVSKIDVGRVHAHGRGYLVWKLGLEPACPDLAFDFLDGPGVVDALMRCCRCTTDSVVSSCKSRDEWTSLTVVSEEELVDDICLFRLAPAECNPDPQTCPYAMTP